MCTWKTSNVQPKCQDHFNCSPILFSWPAPWNMRPNGRGKSSPPRAFCIPADRVPLGIGYRHKGSKNRNDDATRIKKVLSQPASEISFHSKYRAMLRVLRVKIKIFNIQDDRRPPYWKLCVRLYLSGLFFLSAESEIWSVDAESCCDTNHINKIQNL